LWLWNFFNGYIGFADRQYHRDEGPQENWRFLGLMSFSDPIQENAVTAIEKCRLAGVKVNYLYDRFTTEITNLCRLF